jgi:hypothetical protein
MRNQLARVFLTLLAIIPAAACDDEPLSPAHAGAPSEVETAAADEQASIGGPRDLAAMEAIVNTFDEAWTAGDFVRYAAQYAGAEWVGPDGTILTDPAAITGLYEFVIGTLFANTTRTSTIRRLTFLTGTIAVLDIETRVRNAQSAVVGHALEKNILLKRGGAWRIVQHQQVLVAPAS